MKRTLFVFCTRTLGNGTKLKGTFSPRTQHLTEGIAIFPDGRIYKGQFDESNGQPLKKSSLEDDGDMYVGEFNCQWQRNGNGEAWLADGTRYTGRFESDDLVEGVVRIPNGTTETVFEGKLSDESFVEGTLTQHDFVYTGQFRNNGPHGKGKLLLATGAEQTGSFVDGKLHGLDCKMKLEGGHTYVGEFINGIIRRGTLYTPTYTYEGEFNENFRADGEGTQTLLASSPRLVFTGIWQQGQMSRGVCKDEYGAPVDWKDNHDLHKAMNDGDEESCAATRHCYTKMNEGASQIKEMNRSFQQDATLMKEVKGKYPTKLDLGYEHSISAGRDAVMNSISRESRGVETRAAATECLATADRKVKEGVINACSIEIDRSMAHAKLLDQTSAQQVLSERIGEQHQRFLKTFSDDKVPSGLNIDGNAPWKAFTP